MLTHPPSPRQLNSSTSLSTAHGWILGLILTGLIEAISYRLSDLRGIAAGLKRASRQYFNPQTLHHTQQRPKFMRQYELSLDEFDALRAIVRGGNRDERAHRRIRSTRWLPLSENIGLRSAGSQWMVIGAEGLMYRCGLQVGETKRAVGALVARDTPVEAGENSEWWETFDPTKAPTCSKCSFLPVCWGGCPKKHLEGDQHALQEQGRYWRNNLPRLIARAAGIDDPQEAILPEELQFR